MNEFSKYEGCTYLICNNSIEYNVEYMDGTNIMYTFNKDTKYKCRVFTDDDRGWIYILYNETGREVIFNTWLRRDIELITQNFITQAEHRNNIIDAI